MRAEFTVNELFAAAGLVPCAPIKWNEACNEMAPGVYVVAVEGEIAYIGRSKRPLSRRIKEFYRHKYGDRRPHRGGQEILKMQGDRVIYWSITTDPVSAERKMIGAYEKYYGHLPVANKKHGDGAVIFIDNDENAD